MEESAKRKLLGLEGVKEKTVENILGIALFKGRERMDLASAVKTADEFIKPLKKNPYARKYPRVLRRMQETVGDIDILAVSAIRIK